MVSGVALAKTDKLLKVRLRLVKFYFLRSFAWLPPFFQRNDYKKTLCITISEDCPVFAFGFARLSPAKV